MHKYIAKSSGGIVALIALLLSLSLLFVGCGDKSGENQDDLQGDNAGDEIGNEPSDTPDDGTENEPGNETGDEPYDKPVDIPGSNPEDNPGNEPEDKPDDNTDDDQTGKPVASGTISVSTTNTYCYIDKYSFTASETGTYSFTIPAGLGFISSTALKPEVDFQLSPNGGVAKISLEKGDVMNFAVGAATRGNWTIKWEAVSGKVEKPQEPDYDVIIEANDKDGYTFTYTATKMGSLTVTVTDLAYDYIGDGRYVVATADALELGFPRMYSLVINGVNFKHYTATVDVKAGEKVTIQLYCNYGYATKANIQTTLASGGGSTGSSYPGDKTYNVALDANDADGYSFNYTVTQSGTLTVTVASLQYDYLGQGSYTTADADTFTYGFTKMYALEINGTNVGSYTSTLTVKTGDVISIRLYSHHGYATHATIVVGYSGSGNNGQGNTGAALGSETNPICLGSFPESITFKSDAESFTYYVIIAQKTGKITITWPTADSWYMITELKADGTNTSNGTSGYNTESFSFDVVEGKKYALSIGTWSASGEVTVTMKLSEG